MTKTTIQFRALSPWDQAAVDYCRGGYGAHVIPPDARDLIGRSRIPAGFVAKLPCGRFVGRAVLGFESDPAFLVEAAGGAESPWIYAVYVEDAFRGLGIGTQLIKSCIEYLAKHCNARFVCLDSNTAGPWYQSKFGFIKSHTGVYDGKVMEIFYRPITKADRGFGFSSAFRHMDVEIN